MVWEHFWNLVFKINGKNQYWEAHYHFIEIDLPKFQLLIKALGPHTDNNICHIEKHFFSNLFGAQRTPKYVDISVENSQLVLLQSLRESEKHCMFQNYACSSVFVWIQNHYYFITVSRRSLQGFSHFTGASFAYLALESSRDRPTCWVDVVKDLMHPDQLVVELVVTAWRGKERVAVCDEKVEYIHNLK